MATQRSTASALHVTCCVRALAPSNYERALLPLATRDARYIPVELSSCALKLALNFLWSALGGRGLFVGTVVSTENRIVGTVEKEGFDWSDDNKL